MKSIVVLLLEYSLGEYSVTIPSGLEISTLEDIGGFIVSTLAEHGASRSKIAAKAKWYDKKPYSERTAGIEMPVVMNRG